jgi:hypothetical protein
MEFETLPRKELQVLAKQHGIKVNLSTVTIIDVLRVLLPKSEETTEADHASKQSETIKEEEEGVIVKPTVPPKKV